MNRSLAHSLKFFNFDSGCSTSIFLDFFLGKIEKQAICTITIQTLEGKKPIKNQSL